VKASQASAPGRGQNLCRKVIKIQRAGRERRAARAGQVEGQDRVPVAYRVDEGAPVRRRVRAGAVDKDQSGAGAGGEVVERGRGGAGH
jgi:hypothetical protein